MSEITLPSAPRAPDNVWMIDGRISDPINRTKNLQRGPHAQLPLAFITLHSDNTVLVERELADELHDYLVFTTTDKADRICVDLPAQGEGEGLSVIVNTQRFHVTLNGLNQFVVFRTQGGDDLINVADDVTHPILIDAGEGSDRIWAGGGYSRIFAGPGEDMILTRRGACYIEAGDGNDKVVALADGDMTVYSGAGDDTVIGAQGQAFINGGEGHDHLTGGGKHNILVGGPGDDILQAGPHSNVMYAGHGMDLALQLKPRDIVFKDSNTILVAAQQFSVPASTSGNSSPIDVQQARVTDINYYPLIHSGVRVVGSLQFQQRVNDDLSLLAQSPNGQQLLQALYAAQLIGGTPINIYELQDESNGLFAPGNEWEPRSFIENDQRGIPAYGGSIYYNPTFIGNRMTNIPLLYHELCHAYNAVTGTTLPGYSEDGVDGDKARPLIRNSELQAVGLPTDAAPFDFDNDPSTPPTNSNPVSFSENGIREELNMPPRKQYSFNPV